VRSFFEPIRGVYGRLRSYTAYEQVNAALNDVLFSGRFAGRPVYLSLDNKSRDLLANKLHHTGTGLKDKIAKIVGGTLDSIGDPYVTQCLQAKSWRKHHTSSPPSFTALLFALSHAAGLMTAEGDFGAGNYYDRLSRALDFPAPALRAHGKSTLFFWRMFSAWLAENDFEYGRPTAKAFNSNTYVNYPQSQAVIRAGDRHLFHHLFERFQLSRSDSVSVSEIEQYVASWIHSSASNSRLKSAWAKRELRKRFCEIVQAELEEWSDETQSGTGEKTRVSRLSLACSLVQQFPKPRLHLSLGRNGDIPTSLFVEHSTQNGFKARLANEIFGSLATLTPNPMDAMSGILNVGLSMSSHYGSLTWSPRLVIPMRKSEEGPYWIEAARVGFGTSHLVLVKDIPRLRREIDTYLSEASSGSARIATPDSLPGLPDGWVAYTDFQIIVSGLDMATRKDLEPLAPLQDQAGIVPDGGLRLASGIWHAHSPPSLNFMSTAGPTQLEIIPYSEENEAPLVLQKEQSRQANIKAGQLVDLGPGEYIATACSGDEQTAEATIILRSASAPRPLARQGAGELEYLNPISARPKSLDGLPALEHSQNPLERLQVGSRQNGAPLTAELPKGSADANRWHLTRPLIKAGGQENCVTNGYHIWLCETPDRDAPRSIPVLMQCKKCGQSILTKNRGKKPTSTSKTTHSPISWSSSQAVVPDIDHDLFLDALCFLGSGSIAKLESLLAGDTDQPWRVTQLATNYSALGFIDLHRDPSSGRILAWSVPSPTVTFRDNRTAIYSGFRSRETCVWLKSFAASLGGKAIFSPIAGRPASITIQEIDFGKFSAAITEKVDPLGRSWSVIEDIAGHYSQLFKMLQPIGGAMSPASIAGGDINAYYDTLKAKWLQVTNPQDSGAFRAGFAGTIYAYRDEGGNCVTGPYQLVKLLAARDNGSRLHHYREASNTFLSTLGAEPIGLYERALVSSSGALPETSNGLLHYQGVPNELGQMIIHQLYEAPLA